MYGLSDDEIEAIREGYLEAFAAAEVALLRMADAMADTPSNVSDELYQELRRHFSEEQLIELAATAALEKLPCAIQPSVRCGKRRIVSQGSEVQAALNLG
jgi:alkylhydroperoxidase family enzyme